MGSELQRWAQSSACKGEKILEMDGGDGCTRTWMFLIPLNCVLRNSEFHVYLTRVKEN